MVTDGPAASASPCSASFSTLAVSVFHVVADAPRNRRWSAMLQPARAPESCPFPLVRPALASPVAPAVTSSTTK